MSSSLRAAFVIDRLTAGAGTENQLTLLLEHFPRYGLDPHLVCLRQDAAFPRDRISCPMHILHGQSVVGINGWRNMRMVAGLAREHRWQVIVTFFRDANAVGTVGGKMAGVPVVSSRRNLGKNYWHTGKQILALKVLNRWAAGIVANSEAAKSYTVEAEGVAGDMVRVIPNAIESGRFTGDPDPQRRSAWGARKGEVVIGCVANLRGIKGVDILLRAFSQLQTPTPVRLVLVGDGEDAEQLRRSARSLGVDSRVHFAGRLKDVAPAMACFDVAVLPSRGESSSNALLEYLATGLPVVATRVGGTPELIDHGVNGLLVPPEDPEALARELAKVVESAALRRELAQAARKTVTAGHDPAKVVPLWVDYLKTLARKP